MTDRKLSQLQKEYQDFFREKLRLFGVRSPAELSRERKSEFFSSIKKDWGEIRNAKKQLKPTVKEEFKVRIENPQTFSEEENLYRKKETPPVKELTKYRPQLTKQLVKSEPNKEQTDDLKILYTPNNFFSQKENYCYPVVKMPTVNCSLKLPRMGRSNKKGYKENDFYSELKQEITGLELTNNVHMVIPNYNMPYEPDIVLFDKSLNLYINIEIDEPYDGYFRFPTHFIKIEEETKQDDIRDLFFTESGWIVMRFTEKQVHLQSKECIDYIKNVIHSIYQRDFINKTNCEIEEQWDENLCIQWQKKYYREKYLGIDRFKKQYTDKEIEIDIKESETIEKVIQRTKKYNIEITNSEIAFDELTHKYIHPKDQTGNAEYISVTTMIERFFPFDLKRYIERKAKEENRTEDDVLDEYLIIRDEAADKGTLMHNQIENYLTGKEYQADSMEFEHFLNFYNREIKSRDLHFEDAEKKILSHEYNVAGTIDCLFKKGTKNEYVIVDWKRSKNLIVDDGNPKKYGYGYALSELNQLDNSSYYKYCLQQNIYKHIAEKEYAIKISSMKLVVLHENYPKYYIVNVPEMKKEAVIILNSLKHKI